MKADDACWTLTTGEDGMRSQARGLAEAVGLPVTEKRIALRRPWPLLPASLPMPLAALDPTSDPLEPPWPSLLIACGRRSIAAALAVKRHSGGRTVAVYIQNPGLARGWFDLVVPMVHDGVDGANVVAVRTALHAVTEEKLAEARDIWRARLMPDDAPFVGVLVGGNNRGYRLTLATVARLVHVLKDSRARHGLRAVATPSRRTGEEMKRALAETFAADDLGTLWDGTADNPYFGILGLAERLIVTGESVSMISEALAAGKPVHVLPLEGYGRRHEAFLAELSAARLVSLIDGETLDWSFQGHEPVQSAEEPARRIREMLGRRDEEKRG